MSADLSAIREDEAKSPDSTLDVLSLAAGVYEGLSPEEIADIERSFQPEE